MAARLLALAASAALAAGQTSYSLVSKTSEAIGASTKLPTLTTANDQFGYSMTQCGTTGQFLLIGTPFHSVGPSAPATCATKTLCPGVQVALSVNGAFISGGIAIPASSAAGFGTDVLCVSTADGGAKAIVGAMGVSVGGVNDEKGSAFIYSISSTGVLSSPPVSLSTSHVSQLNGDNFGSSVALDNSGSYAMACSPKASSSTGACYIYSGSSFGTQTLVGNPGSLTYSFLGGNDGSIDLITPASSALVAVMGAPDTSASAAGSVVFAFFALNAGGVVGAQSTTLQFFGGGNPFYPAVPFINPLSPPAGFTTVPSTTVTGAQWVCDNASPKNCYNMAAAAGDSYGTMITASQDGSLVFVGASGYLLPANTFVGYVDVYRITPGSTPHVSLVQTLYPPNAPGTSAEAKLGFGTGIAVSADNKRLVIGAGAGTTAPGRVYTFALASNGKYNLESTIASPNAAGGDGFGYCVGIAADKSSITVSAPMDSGGAGAVYKYSLPAVASAAEPPAALAVIAAGLAAAAVAAALN